MKDAEKTLIKLPDAECGPQDQSDSSAVLWDVFPSEGEVYDPGL
jgi:hypothetical protein